MSTIKVNFSIDGKSIIKEGRKIIAKVYNRSVFYPAHNINSGFSPNYPYSLEITGIGSRECSSIDECIMFIEKYK